MKRDYISWVLSDFLVTELPRCLFRDLLIAATIGRPYKCFITQFRAHDALCIRRRTSPVSAVWKGRFCVSRYYFVRALRRRESSIAYSVLRRITDSSYVVWRPCIVHCTIHLFHAFVFQRGRSIYAENGTIASRYTWWNGRRGDPSLGKKFFLPIKAKRWRWNRRIEK